MRLESVRELKERAPEIVERKFIRPYCAQSDPSVLCLPFALGIQPRGKRDYKLAIHIKDESDQELIEDLVQEAHGEVDIKVTGDVCPQSANSHYEGSLSIGLSISHYTNPADWGTLGAFVRKSGQDDDLYILSNNHVLAQINTAQLGDDIIQTAQQDGIRKTEPIASLSHFIPLKQNDINVVDAAIAKVTTERERDIVNLNNIGSLQGFLSQSEMIEASEANELAVAKLGARTGLTRGKINCFEVTRPIPYQTIGGIIEYYQFDQFIAFEGVEGQPFSQPGDSGSIIVDCCGYALGLLVAGNNTITYANPIDVVLQELDIELAGIENA